MRTRILAITGLLMLVVAAGGSPFAESSLPPVPLPVWHSEVAVPGAAGSERASAPHTMALDAADNPYLLYYQASTEELRWAARKGGTWTTSLVAEVGPSDLELALGIGPDSVPQIAYIDGDTDRVMVGTLGPAGWNLQLLTTGAHNLSLTIGPDSRPHLILVQQNRLIYWTRQGSAWQSEPASPTGVAVRNAALALDSQGRPKVVYSATGAAGLTIAVREAKDNWTAEVLPFRLMRAMAVGPDDAVYLIHVTSRQEPGKPPVNYVSLWLAEQQGSEWQDTLLYDDWDIGQPLEGRLLFDADGRLHVVNHSFFQVLEYHRREVDGQWSGEGLGFSHGTLALGVGSDGQPRVSRQQGTDLLLSTRDILLLEHHALLPVVPRYPN